MTQDLSLAAPPHAEAAEFVALFGEVGAVWYAEGVTKEAARQRHASSVHHRIIVLENQLEATAKVTGEAEPAGFAASDAPTSRGGFASKLRFPDGSQSSHADQ